MSPPDSLLPPPADEDPVDDELREVFDYILDHYQDYPRDPGYDQRVAFERMRYDAGAEARRKSLAAG